MSTDLERSLRDLAGWAEGRVPVELDTVRSRLRRRRAVRDTAASAVGVGAAGAVAFGAIGLNGAGWPGPVGATTSAPTASADPTPEPSGTEEPAASEDITLTVATYSEFGYESLIEEYMEANPGITVEHIMAATTYEARDKLLTSLAAGSGAADVEAVETEWWPELMTYADSFEDLAHEDVEGRWLPWKTEEATTPDGKLIGYGTNIGPGGVCYRADLFEAADLPTDREEVATLLEGDWETYFTVGEQFVANSDVAWFDSGSAVYSTMVNQVAQPYENEDGTPKDLASNEEIKAIYDQVVAASTERELSAGLGQWGEDWTDSFQTDGFATMLCPGWMLEVIEGNAAGVTGWDIADVFPGGGGNWGGSYLAVPSQSEHPEEARELAAWLTAPEQQLKASAATGTFPSQLEALDSEELRSAVNPFFNNAPVGEILANRAAAITVQPFKGPNYFSIHTIVTDAVTRVDVDGADPAESWETALSDYANLGLS